MKGRWPRLHLAVSRVVWSKVLCSRGALPSSAGELCRARTFVSFSQVSEGGTEWWLSTKEAQRWFDGTHARWLLEDSVLAEAAQISFERLGFLILEASVASPVDLTQINLGYWKSDFNSAWEWRVSPNNVTRGVTWLGPWTILATTRAIVCLRYRPRNSQLLEWHKCVLNSPASSGCLRIYSFGQIVSGPHEGFGG